MSSFEHALFQKVMLGTKEIIYGALTEGCYIETADLSGPKLILTVVDDSGWLRDEWEVKEGMEVEVSISMPSGGAPQFKEKFVIVKMPITGGVASINAFQKDVWELKQPNTKAEMYTGIMISELISKMFPKMQVESDAFDKPVDFCVMQGQTRANALRRLLRDVGAVMWVARGKVYIKKHDSLSSGSPSRTLTYNGKDSENAISDVEFFKLDTFFKRAMSANYLSWSIVKGMSSAGGDGSDVILEGRTDDQLKEQNRHVLPLAELTTSGNTQLTPMQKIKLELYRVDNADNTNDESLPTEVHISRVSHFQRGRYYMCSLDVAELKKDGK